MDQILPERLFLVWFKRFDFEWPFSTNEGQYKQAIGTHGDHGGHPYKGDHHGLIKVTT